ncbi:MAG: hypothetical protein FJ271_20380 [Planctomycetes bacterium]|nr:hypothetical protein [Planctomycetota bacterium]
MFLHSLLATVALVPLPVDGNNRVRLPNGPQPTFVVVRAVDGDHVTALQHSSVTVPVTYSQQVIVNGVTQTVTKTAYRQESRVIERRIALKTATFYNGAGDKLTAEDGRKNLKAGATILLSENGRPVDPIYLRAIRGEALILAIPFAPPLVPSAPQVDVPSKK